MIKIFTFWRIGLFLTTILGTTLIAKVENGALGAAGPNKPYDYWQSWAQWDGGHYFNIARYGYFNQTEVVFFPLFPVLTRLFTFLFAQNYLLSGLFIANTAFLVFLIVFYNLTKLEFTKKIARSTTFSLLTFPTAFFAVSYYSESLFLALAAFSLLLLTKKKLMWACFFAALASATRFVGIFLIIPIAFYYFKSIKRTKVDLKILAIPLSISGFLIYSIYLYLKFNNPLYFLISQSHWHRELENPATTIAKYLSFQSFNDLFDLIATIFAVSLLFWGRKKIPKPLWLLSAFAILTPILSGTLTSMPRYILSAFPIFIILAVLLEKKTMLRNFLWGISLISQTLLCILFLNGYWVA